MKRSKTVAVTAMFMSLVAGCSDGESEAADFTAVCVDQENLVRVDDSLCLPECTNRPSSGVLWYFIGTSLLAPAVGSRASGGSHTRPPSGSVGFAPKTGGFGTHTGTGS